MEMSAYRPRMPPPAATVSEGLFDMKQDDATKTLSQIWKDSMKRNRNYSSQEKLSQLLNRYGWTDMINAICPHTIL